MYVVAVYGSSEAARQANLAARDKGQPLGLGDTQAPVLPLARPINGTTEWLRGYLTRVSWRHAPPMRDCYAISGVRYRNVLMLARVDHWISAAARGDATCQGAHMWTTRVLTALYVRTQSYVQQHGSA